LNYSYSDENRRGDHICYISDIRKVQAHYPDWTLAHDRFRILDELIRSNVTALK